VKAKSKREAAGQGPRRSRQGQGCPLREPSEPNGERGNPAAFFAVGRRVRGEMALVTFPERKVTRRAGAEPR
jgi:hypothetical protein